MTAGEINIGWGAILETFEMSIFAFVHIKAFSYKPYRPLTPNAKRTPRLRSFAHAMDFRETFRELHASLVYMYRRMRGVETDPLARRMAVLENAFDKSRLEMRQGHPRYEKELVLEVNKTVEVAVDGEKQWLGVGDNDGYGLSRRERSEALDIQFGKEGGYGHSDNASFHQSHTHTCEHKYRSWKRSRYERAAQSNPDHEEPVASSSSPKRKRDLRNPEESVRVYDDHPPPSILRTYRGNRTASQTPLQDEKVPQLPQNDIIQDLPGPPVRDQHPLPHVNVNIAIARADTVFARLFSKQPVRSDGGHTSLSGSGSVVSPSSQSHRTHLPLNAAPTVLPENIDAGRPVEAATWRPGSPNAHDVQELYAEPAVLPDLPNSPPPIQQRRLARPDRNGLQSPPPLPPKGPRRSAHRRELAHFQSSLAHDAASTRAVPAPNSVSDPERITISSRKEERSHHIRPVADMRRLPDPQIPLVASHRLSTPRANADAISADRASSPRSRASVGVAAPTHTFRPEPTRLPHSKGSPRKVRGLPLRPSSFPLNYSILYSLPDARSPPIAPRADKILSPRRDS